MKKIFKKNFLFLIVLFFLLILSLEIISFICCKFLGIEKKNKNTQRHLYHPYRGHQLNPDYKRKDDTNNEKIHTSKGFRQFEDIPYEKPIDEYRIIFMGGSAAYGIGSGSPYPFHTSLKNNETISFYIEQLLNKDLAPVINKKIKVLNAAVTAYQTFQHLIYINEILYKYSPDLVIFFDGNNDFYFCNPEFNHFLDYQYSSIKLISSFNNKDLTFSFYSLTNSLSKYSFFFTLLSKISQKIWEQSQQFIDKTQIIKEPDFYSNYEKTAINTYIKAYKQIETLANIYKFKMIVCLQPQIIFEDPKQLNEYDLNNYQITIKNLKNDLNDLFQIRSFIFKVFDKYFPSLPFLDLSKLIDSKYKENIYLDYCYLSPFGAKKSAEKICNYIILNKKNLID
ncbi:MAG TPA: hypothetical protein PK189_00370 [bacterium]|nr:hypothetical protein [bacterium]